MAESGADDGSRSSDDVYRRAALFASGLLALHESPRLHELLAELADALTVPIAGICVLGHGHCWLPVAHGLASAPIAERDTFAVQVVETLTPIAFADLTTEPQHADGLLTRAPLNFWAYAAAPLRGVGGTAIGTVIAADTKPRPDFPARAIPALEDVAVRIMEEAGAPHHMRRIGRMALDGLEDLIRQATRDGDDALVSAIDKVMRDVLPRTGLRGV
ncbi:hypothetical protein J2Y54_003026 [Sphingomonas sp. BE123]|uniref:GAF domain-containing protein n=1 Tax=Sphingomonas sp. BE123 TaxID=2817842 RepID=UPI00285B20ED|nr:GAF domain-containing protein [Sphingomonas sp. BE123]MDR6853506.1 hypothetical protein [Sphingomonas sp. BE123]